VCVCVCVCAKIYVCKDYLDIRNDLQGD